MAINWDYWLKRRAIHEIEISLLTLGLDPESYPINSLAGEQWVDERDLNEKKKEFDMRRNLILDYRFKPYEYMKDDGEWGNYFADGYNNKILVKRFLRWLKNEDFGWDLPKELQAYIEKLDMPNQEHWAQGLVDNLNKKITQSEVIQKVIIKPKEWNPLAEQYADDILKSNPQISLEKISIQIAEKFKVQGIQSVHGKPIKPTTISRVLSDWGFTLKRINADKK